MALIIDTSLCVGCGACVGGCPNGALELRDGVAAVEENACVLCGVCVQSCPVGAIDIPRESAHTEDVEQYRGVWVYAQCHGELLGVSLELTGLARRLADEKGSTVTVLLGGGTADCMSKVFEELGNPVLSEHFLLYTFAMALVFCIGLNLVQKKGLPGKKEWLYGLLVGVPNFFSAKFLLEDVRHAVRTAGNGVALAVHRTGKSPDTGGVMDCQVDFYLR